MSAPLLGKVMHLWASLPRDEWRDFDRKLERVVELVGREHGAEGTPMLAMAVALRLMALDALVLDPAFRGWLITEHAPGGITATCCGSRRSSWSLRDRMAIPRSTGTHFAQTLWN